MGELLSPLYGEGRRALMGATASSEMRPGAPGGRLPRLPGYVLAGGPELPAVPGGGEPTMSPHAAGSGDTCHVDVVDRWGNIVSATPSGGWLQSSPTIPELGFCLGSRAQMFWLDEGLPSALVPAARPRTTLTPTLVLPDRWPGLACRS